jgi:predicted ATPase/DNA-binding SARP family transcriptional activator
MEFRILGPLEVRRDGHAVVLGGGRPRALLAVLLLRANEPVSAERLAGALWGEDAPTGAARTVQVYVSRLRRALGDETLLATTPAGYRLRVDPGELDSAHFERLLEDGRRALSEGRAGEAGALLRDALALWRGPPLADLAYAPFAQAEIARLDEQRLAALEARVEADLAAGRHAELVGELQRLVSEHPLRERLHGQLMLALYRSGRQADALQAYQDARATLVDQLGIEPATELRDLHQAVLTHAPRLDMPRPGVVPPAVNGMTGVSAPPTRLFGREEDLERLGNLVGQPNTRLLTLLGPGGVGKTRLAIEAARRLAGGFTDGASFVALAPLSDPGELASAVAVALAVPLREGERPATALLRFLADRQLLLVLDNLEHLLAGASLVADVLASCPRITILLTSREPTQLSAERLYPVRPLELPAASEAAWAELERYAAVALFCDRARARDPGFALDAGSAPHVRAICLRLDGLPLAIELAAARIGLLSPGELAARLTDALAILTAGARDAPERQRTLRATIDWSYGLLADNERRAFAYFAVFAGGANVTSAETVTGAALDTLDSLVAKQLLTRRDERLLMLETVREYAVERLAADPDADTIRERLAVHCLGLAEEATQHLVRADRVPWLARLDAELPNARAAILWALEADRAEQALQLVSAWAEYWWHTNRQDDGLTWIDAALERARDAPPRARARALLQRARLTGWRRHQRHCEDLQASLQLFRTCGDASGIAACLGYLAFANASVGQYERANSLSDEALRFAERAQDEAVLASALTKRALAAATYEDMARGARTAVAALRRSGNLMELARVCSVTGYLAIAERRDQEALAWLDESLEAARRLENAHGVFVTLGNLGLARLFLGDLAGAAQSFRDALAMMTHDQGAGAFPGPDGRPARQPALQADPESGEHPVDETLLGLAAVTACQGDHQRAARLAGAAKSHRTSGRAPQEEIIWKRLEDELLNPAREQCGSATWDHAARQGASLNVLKAIELGLAHASERPTHRTQVRPRRSELN